MPSERHQITLKSIERDNDSRRGEGWHVTMTIERGGAPLDIVVTSFVPATLPEERIIEFARSFLAYTFEELAQKSAQWKLPEGEYQRAVGKTEG